MPFALVDSYLCFMPKRFSKNTLIKQSVVFSIKLYLLEVKLVCQIEYVSFSPPLLEPSATVAYKRLAFLLSLKRKTPYCSCVATLSSWLLSTALCHHYLFIFAVQISIRVYSTDKQLEEITTKII